ncbi:MAG: hypothetical protein WC943_00470 [Elusimicrobiota bacterium]|jgi:hypothetical protein
MKKFIAVLLLAILSGCASAPKLTSLELQAIQKRQYDSSKQIVFASAMSVFQDLGYTIKSADIQTGLIQAQSPTESTVFFGSYMSNVEATAFVEELSPAKSSIRLNFVQVNESSSGYGMKSKSDTPIVDSKVYQNAFTKIQEAIFIRTNTQ